MGPVSSVAEVGEMLVMDGTGFWANAAMGARPNNAILAIEIAAVNFFVFIDDMVNK
jgi:hypothetical protein